MNEKSNEVNAPLFRDLAADDEEQETMEIESLCMQCMQNGMTRMLLTKIPFYKEIVLYSFLCSHCGWENNELQPVSKIQEEGIKFILKVTNIKDLSRQIVKTEWASVTIPEIEFEIPSKTQEGVVTNIEGLIQRAISGIGQRIQSLSIIDPEGAEQLVQFLKKLSNLLVVSEPFTFILNDASGNSFVENLQAPQKDPNMDVLHFVRSDEENKMIGIVESTQENESGNNEEEPIEERLGGEVLSFSTNCPNCNAPCETNMKVTKIPHFKEVVIMATNCAACGHRTNEVKSGSGIEPMGTKLCLVIRDHEDLTRDLLKSETCEINIPEIELEVGGSAIGGKFTTVEGLLENIKEQLRDQNPMLGGDSARPDMKGQMAVFLCKIDDIVQLKRKATLILDDPCGNSYLQSLDDDDDDRLTITKYERTFEQNEDLGLNDMVTENYEQS